MGDSLPDASASEPEFSVNGRRGFPVLKMDWRVILWGMIFAGGARLATTADTAWAVLGWQVCFLLVAPFLMPLRYAVGSVLATVVFLDASLWFQPELFGPNTIYEVPGAWLKPPEILFLVLALRTAHFRASSTLTKQMSRVCIAWIFVVFLGSATSLLNNIPVGLMITFSEIRSPLIAAFGLFLIVPFVGTSPRFFIDGLAWMILLHFVVSSVSWAFGVSLLWRSYAPNYAQHRTAFFGADESVTVYLLGFTIAVALVSVKKKDVLSQCGPLFWILILGITTFAILMSLRRGGVLALAVVLLVVLVGASIERKARLLVILLVAVPVLFLVFDRSGALAVFAGRLAGEGSAAVSDAGHSSDIEEATRYVRDHFWFGTGPGTVLSLTRTEAYGVSGSLAVHNSILYVWIRFGLFGAAIYTGLFLVPIVQGLRASLRQSGNQSMAARQSIVVSMAGLLMALFVWGLQTPGIFLNFRQGGVWLLAVAMLYGSLPRQLGIAGRAGTSRHELLSRR